MRSDMAQHNTASGLCLQDLGERRLIEEVLRPRLNAKGVESFGDDCAHLGVVGDAISGVLVATTDPCPEPMAAILGFTDLFYRGWLLATINLSDLAAAGARPLGLVTSFVLPPTMLVSDLMRLLDGVDACCAECYTRVVGGNLKETPKDNPKIDMAATAIGLCETKPLSRVGAQAGDWIAVIGDLGLFWAGVLAVQSGLLDSLSLAQGGREELLRNVLTPRPKVRLGRDLAAQGLLSACQDNSDGLYPTLFQLAETNGLRVEANFSSVSWAPEILVVADSLQLDPVRFALGWGDWQLIGCGKEERRHEVETLCQGHKIPVHFIGHLAPGSGVWLTHKNHRAPMIPLDSQRFTLDSWFTTGISAYIDALTQGTLWHE